MPRLLIVDDSVSVRKALERILAPHKLEVFTAESAEAALQVLHDHEPHLIIADVVMPGMDGFELTQVLKADAKHKHIPVILISGIVNQSVHEQAKEVGAIDVIKKPFNPTDLLPKIQKILNQSQARHNTQAQPSAAPISLKPSKDPSFAALERQVEPFLSTEDIESVMLVTAQGDCLLNLGREIEDPATFAGYFKFFTSAASVLGDKLNANNLTSVLLEYHDKVLLMQRVNPEVSVVLSLRDMTVLSVARFLLNKQLPAITKALYAEANT
ncbi:MAG: response regulator [Trueperaceae bacterium]|nr:response regulator [Trueperaceae bacterium]